jgi:hypothetical protein
MLVRRFTIVCLIIALFGMALSVLVAEAHRTAATEHWRATNCTETGCLPTRR